MTKLQTIHVEGNNFLGYYKDGSVVNAIPIGETVDDDSIKEYFRTKIGGKLKNLKVETGDVGIITEKLTEMMEISVEKYTALETLAVKTWQRKCVVDRFNTLCK